jgi:hypothetical protein
MAASVRIRVQRSAAQLLSRPARSAVKVVEALLAVQAQERLVVMGPPVGGAPAFVLTVDALGLPPLTRLDGDAREWALPDLARRYLRGTGRRCRPILPPGPAYRCATPAPA